MDSIFFEKINKKKIFCCSSEPTPSQKKIVIMSHGFRGSSVGPARTFVDFTRLLVSHGFSVLRFDQPNSGNSDGDYLDSSFNEWVGTITYFAKKYLDKGYEIALLGQSMGATATMIAATREELKDKIPCIILWVPDPKSTFDKPKNAIYEEGGQKYRGSFWQEARDADFFKCLREYKGGIHLVYGERDKFVSEELREQITQIVETKNQSVMVLKGQGHSDWKHDENREVYTEELKKLQKYFRMK